MKILLVSIPNHHFFQWVNQLKESGFEVIWFDITDGGPQVERIKWVKQIKGWKLHWDFPFRHRIKNYFPKLYSLIQKYNERKAATVFEKLVQESQPDSIHVFEMMLSGLPLLTVLEKYSAIPLVYSSWGSDMFYFTELGVGKSQVLQFLKRVDYLITDCQRDYHIAVKNGFANKFLGVLPGNGGIAMDTSKIKECESRNTILIKGYDDGVGMASNVIKALKQVPLNSIKNYSFVLYSADISVVEMIKNDVYFKDFKLKIIQRGDFISNEELLEIMGNAILHIGNSVSDGMPNALLEAMGMGAFPIQSNPGRVTEEVITHNQNGYLITNPLDINEIAGCIEKAISNTQLRKMAQSHNVDFIQKNASRGLLQKQISALYKQIQLKVN